MIISLFIRKIIMMYTKNLAVNFKTDRDSSCCLSIVPNGIEMKVNFDELVYRSTSQSYLMELKFEYHPANLEQLSSNLFQKRKTLDYII